jgi:acetolactate synthase-1/2/3 large subunit
MFPKNATLIRVDIDSDELAYDIAEKIAGKNVKQISVNTDAKSFLTFLSANLACENLQSESCNAENTSAKCIKKFQNRFDDVKKLQEKFDGCDRELGNLFMEEISKHILPNSVITADVGQNQVWAAQSLQIKGEHSRILIGGGYGSMGCSLPYAISGTVSDISSQNSISGGLLGNSSRIESGEENTNPIGNSHQITYCIAGDGGFQMNIQELQTVVRENLPVKIFVFNNVSLGMIRVFQTELFDNRFAYTVGSGGYTVPDFCAVAKAYGIKSAKISAPSEFAGYADWFSDNEPCLFDVFLDEGTKLMPKIMFGKGGYGE